MHGLEKWRIEGSCNSRLPINVNCTSFFPSIIMWCLEERMSSWSIWFTPVTPLLAPQWRWRLWWFPVSCWSTKSESIFKVGQPSWSALSTAGRHHCWVATWPHGYCCCYCCYCALAELQARAVRWSLVSVRPAQSFNDSSSVSSSSSLDCPALTPPTTFGMFSYERAALRKEKKCR